MPSDSVTFTQEDENRYRLALDADTFDVYVTSLRNGSVEVIVECATGGALDLYDAVRRVMGEFAADRDSVKAEFDRTKAEGLPTRIPSHSEHEQALRVIATPWVRSPEELAWARNTVTVYERVHGLT